jgi:hypothetical protein
MRYVPRYPFRADAEITDVESGIRVKGLADELSLFGCGFYAFHGFEQDAKVQIKLVHDDLEITAIGRVVYARPDLGTGVAFTAVGTRDERILCGWIAKLMSRHVSLQSGQPAPRKAPSADRGCT